MRKFTIFVPRIKSFTNKNDTIMKEIKTNRFGILCMLLFAMSILTATSCNTKKEAKAETPTEAVDEKAEEEAVPANMKTLTEMGCSFNYPNEMEDMKDFDGNVNKEEGSGFLTVGGKPSFSDAINYEVKTIDKPLTKKDMEEGFKQITSREKGNITKKEITDDGIYFEMVTENSQMGPKPIHTATRFLAKGTKSLMVTVMWMEDPDGIISKNKDAIIKSMKIE